MKRARFPVVLMLIMTTLSVGVAMNTRAVSIAAEPNWLAENPIYRESSVSLADNSCSLESRVISGVSPRVYVSNTDSTTQDVCVYYAKGFEYAQFTRAYYINPWSTTSGTLQESGLAFSFGGDNTMTPSFDIGNPDSPVQPYLGNSTGFVQQRNMNGNISYYKNILQHMLNLDNGTIGLDNHPDYELKDALGSPLRAEGLGISQNKVWLSFVTPNVGMISVNLDTLMQRRVGNRYEVYNSTWPTPSPSTSISNDGKYMVVGGWSMETEVISILGMCGGFNESLARDYYQNMPLASSCPYTRLTDLTRAHSPARSAGLRDFKDVRMRYDGSSFDYYDAYKWATIYAHNMRPLSSMRYLALGDSYSSGEGDVTSDGTTHYIPGTNVMGDYARNIPREMCHISDRSYPFLIAKQMSLGSDAMKSIACSGAVANDALTFDANDRLRIHADNYLGQGTQLGKFGGDGPRLTGIAGYEQLQQDALMQTLPGRVQQINHVEKTKPEAITVTMGGNDFGYGAIITSCMNVLNSPIKSDTTCWDAQPDGRQARAQQIHDFYPRLKHLYETLRLSTDSGNVFVIGYPRFFDESFICADMGNLITRTEQTSLNQLINYANATIKAAALDAGVKYIDISDVFDGSELCGRSTSMTSIKSIAFQGVMTEYAKWKQLSDDNIRKYGHINGSFVNTNPIFMSTYLGVRGASIQYDGGSNPYGALTATAQQLVHPNSYGHTLIYDRIHDGLGDELLTSKSCNAIIHCSVLGNDGKPVVQLGAPSPADYIPGTTLSTNGTIYLTGDGAVSIGHIVDKSIVETGGVIARGASKVVISVAKEWLNAQQVELQAPPRLIIHSTPTDLGVMAYDAADDAYSLEVSISPTLDIGAHTLHFVGTTSTGRDIEIISHAFVMGLDGDIDADGISDEYDACVFGEPNGVDKDVDGISDNCDLGIDESKPVIPAPQADVEDNSIASVLGTSDDTDSGTFISGQRAAQGGGAALESILPNISKADGTSARRASNKDWGYLVLPALFILISVLMYAVHRRSIRH